MVVRVLYVVLVLALSALYYEFLGAGPTPSERGHAVAWWVPAGWAQSLDWPILAPLQQIGVDTVQARHEGRFEAESLLPFGLFALPVVLCVAAGFALFRGAWARAALLALGLALVAFCYYGWLDVETWHDYRWRWPAVLLTTAGYLAVFALAPALVADLRRRPRVLQLAALVAFAGPIYLLSIEITGTNPTLEWNLSPWPTVTLYGFLLVGLVLGVIHTSVGVGLAVGARRAGRGAIGLGAAAAAAVALALHRIPFDWTTPLRLAVVALPAAAIAALALRRAAPHPSRAAAFLVAGLVVLGSVKAGQWHAEWFLARARDRIAPKVIDAIERYHAKHDAYPGEIADLVPSELAAIEQPHIGWLDWDEEVFTYTDLGASFLLEFSGPLWVQCAYSPPYEEESDDANAPRERLEASWSCESRPPRLW